jgi:hypothetical protein
MAELAPEDIIAQARGLEDILAGYDAAHAEAERTIAEFKEPCTRPTNTIDPAA